MKFIFLGLIFIVTKNSCAQQKILGSNDWAWDQVGITSDFKKLVGKRKITVAIIDDAFQIENQTIKQFYKTNPKDLPSNFKDEDANGKVDDYLGWDISDNDPDVNPNPNALNKFSHGTKVAGILIECLNKLLTNSKDVVNIIPIKSASDTRNSNYITDGYEGIKYAIEQKADIIICSWSGGIFEKGKEAILRTAEKNGIIIIAASGNFVSEKEQYPGAFHWVVNTASLGKNYRKQLVSNYGNFVDLSLPGDSIFTITPTNNPTNSTLSGTSASTAFLGGIVAAIFAAFPELKPIDLDRVLKNSCESLENQNPLYKGKLGAGVLKIPNLIKTIESQDTSLEYFSTPKGYVQISKTKAIIKSFVKYPNFKIVNEKTQLTKTINLVLEKWENNTKTDTIISLVNLNAPHYFQADSFQIKSTKNIKSKQKSYLYFEAQTIDSSFLYCKETLRVTNKNSIITDGSGDENYTSNSNCKWEIEVAKDKRIKINFEEMDTEAKIDQVYIFSDFGTESPILAIYSGQNLPPQITSWTNRALIWFVTNGSTNLKGWKLRFEEVD